MPIFFEQDVNSSTKLAVWKIEEGEDFFLAHVPLQREITHPHKRLQHLAGRYLLKYLYPDFPVSLIRLASTRKPFLEDEVYHFSLSHCGDYAAVIVSSKNRVGIDVEEISTKVDRIRNKFVGDYELKTFFLTGEASTAISTLIWSCKEAMFKWYGLGEVDFRKHLHLLSIRQEGEMILVSALFNKHEDIHLQLQSRFIENLCISFVVT